MVPILLIASVFGLASAPCVTAKRASHGVIFCTANDVSFKLVGRTTGGKYSVYDYRYKFRPHSSGAVHGGQRLIVFRGRSYVGNYMLQPVLKMVVRGTQVVLKGQEHKQSVRLDFSRTPPRQILVNGEDETFSR